jgi:hypothetical protein
MAGQAPTEIIAHSQGEGTCPCGSAMVLPLVWGWHRPSLARPPRQDGASPAARATGRTAPGAVPRNLPDTTPEQKLRHRQRSRRPPARGVAGKPEQRAPVIVTVTHPAACLQHLKLRSGGMSPGAPWAATPGSSSRRLRFPFGSCLLGQQATLNQSVALSSAACIIRRGRQYHHRRFTLGGYGDGFAVRAPCYRRDVRGHRQGSHGST